MERKKVAIYGAAILAALAIIFLPGLSELHKLRRENAQLQKRIYLLEEHNTVLEEEVGKLQKDPKYVEQKAREKLGIIKEGEIIYKPSTRR